MAVNKIIMNTAKGEEILIDLTGDTVSPETLAEGVTAHNAKGEAITGTMSVISGAYDITATTNEDGTQSLAIVDAGSGGSGSGVKTAQVTIDCTYVTPNTDDPGKSTVCLIYVTKHYAEAYASILAGSTFTAEVLLGSSIDVWPGYELDYNGSMGASGDSMNIRSQSVGQPFFRVFGDGTVSVWSN